MTTGHANRETVVVAQHGQNDAIPPRGGGIVQFTERVDDGCKLLGQLPGNYLIVSAVRARCGMNLRFNGVYQKR